MPQIHRLATHRLQISDGTQTVSPPPIAMILAGPRVQVSVGLAQQFAEALLARGDRIPDPVVGEALIDTGASQTCIDEAIAQRLGLPVVGRTNLCSASHASTQTNLHPIKIDFIGAAMSSNVLQAPACALAAQDLAVLIGRDLLQQFLLVYNGPIGQWTMALAHP